MTVGEYAGGRVRLEGGKQPLYIRDHAVIFDGTTPFTSGKFNGDRWSIILLTHAEWPNTPTTVIRKKMSELGMPCPYQIDVAAPAPGAPADPSEEAPDGGDLALKSLGTREQAKSVAHQMTHMPKNQHCDVCNKAKIQRTRKMRVTSKAVPVEGRKVPTKFGEQVTGDHFIKNTPDDVDEDPGQPKDTVGIVIFDRGTKWLAVYPKASKTTTHGKPCSISRGRRTRSRASTAIMRPS